jgi:hypothetical protein
MFAEWLTARQNANAGLPSATLHRQLLGVFFDFLRLNLRNHPLTAGSDIR